MRNVARDLLRGAVDTHVHAGPDAIPRRMDDLELARSAADAGMGGLVLKSHHTMTAARARVAQKLVPEIKVVGGLALNVPACGGLNVDAVKVALRMGARIIWLPTLSSANHIESIKSRVTGYLGVMSKGFGAKPAVVLDEEGVPLPALREILALVAEADVLLATGHLPTSEVKVVVETALEAGVRRIMVNHPELWLIRMGLEDQRELAARGVMMEHCIRSVTSEGNESLGPRYIADQIKAVGAEHCVMATDYGQRESPVPAQGLLWYIEQMLECGITPDEIELMVKVNPSRLLGL